MISKRAWIGTMIVTATLLACASSVSALSPLEAATAVDEFFFRLEQLEFAHYLAQAAILSKEMSDATTNSQQIIAILTLPPSDEPEEAFVSQVGLIGWARHAADDPAVLSAVRPSIRADYLNSQLLVQGYLVLALIECEQAIMPDQSPTDIDLNLRRTYAFLSTALGTSSGSPSSGGLRPAAAMLPRTILNLTAGDSIQAAVDQLVPGDVLFLDAGEYGNQEVEISQSIFISRSPGASKQVRIVGSSDEKPVFLVRGELASVEFADLTIADGRAAILVQDSASCWISSCALIDNAFAGIESCDGSAVTLVTSRVRGNGLYGILVHGTARVAAIDTDISLNVFLNSPDIGAGVAAKDYAIVTLEQCPLTGNSGYGILLSGQASLMASQISVSYSQFAGILLLEACRLELMLSHLMLNGDADLSIYPCDRPTPQDSPWNPDNVFSGSLHGSGNTSLTYDDVPRVCLGDFVLPEGFFSSVH